MGIDKVLWKEKLRQFKKFNAGNLDYFSTSKSIVVGNEIRKERSILRKKKHLKTREGK